MQFEVFAKGFNHSDIVDAVDIDPGNTRPIVGKIKRGQALLQGHSPGFPTGFTAINDNVENGVFQPLIPDENRRAWLFKAAASPAAPPPGRVGFAAGGSRLLPQSGHTPAFKTERRLGQGTAMIMECRNCSPPGCPCCKAPPVPPCSFPSMPFGSPYCCQGYGLRCWPGPFTEPC